MRQSLHRATSALLLALGACYPQGVNVVCRADSCPTDEQVAGAAAAFSIATGYDVTDGRLTVYWYAPGTDLNKGDERYTVGQTISPDAVEVTSCRTLVHELGHVAMWREFPSSLGDPNHEQEPGPWTPRLNTQIATLSDSLCVEVKP